MLKAEIENSQNKLTAQQQPVTEPSKPVPKINPPNPIIPSRPTAAKPTRKTPQDLTINRTSKPTEPPKTDAEPVPKSKNGTSFKSLPQVMSPKPPTTPRIMLPNGWEQKLDKNSNRYYYIDHRTQTTSWNAPEGASPRPEIDRARKPPERIVQPDWDILSPAHGHGYTGRTGLKNLGNTCYMNAIIQSLASLHPLANYFLQDKFRKDINKNNILGYKGQIAEHFGLVIKGLWHGSFKNLRPDYFKRVISQCKAEFAGTKQQDAQELLLFLLDGLHEDLNKVKERRYIEEKDANGRPDEEVASEAWENHRRLNNSFIVDYFQGQFKNTLKCLSCRYTSIKFDAFMFLSLPIPEKGKSNLADCLKQFQKREKLFGNERWFCPKCKAPKDSERTLELWRVPPLLIIHLKRFRSEGRWKTKLRTDIEYPLNNFTLGVKGPRKQPPYSLVAVTNHQGASTDSGHYTAYCSRKNGWVKADDSEVTSISSSSVVSSNGYILFYSSKPQDQEPGTKFVF